MMRGPWTAPTTPSRIVTPSPAQNAPLSPAAAPPKTASGVPVVSTIQATATVPARPKVRCPSWFAIHE